MSSSGTYRCSVLIRRTVDGVSNTGWITGDNSDMFGLFGLFEAYLSQGKTIEVLGYYPNPMTPDQRMWIRHRMQQAERNYERQEHEQHNQD